MLQATPVCALLFFLARSPGAPELDVRHERATLGLLNRRQRREQRLDRSSVFSVISCWISSGRRIAPAWISFRVFRVFGG